jgi:Protein of unknown function (DUF4236)
MGYLRFYRRSHLFPGISLNVSKSGPSLTLGMRGAHITIGTRSVTRTVGIPGSGVFYTSRAGYHSGVHSGDDRIGEAMLAVLATSALVVGIGIGMLLARV